MAGVPTTEFFTTSQVWTVPNGVFNVTVHCIGAGGGGGGGANSASNGGGGGGGGAYMTVTVPVSAGQQYTITVGQGGIGAAGRGNDGLAGSATSFASLCIANPGQGGLDLTNNGGFGGAGGVGGTGDSGWTGGSGGDGSATGSGGGGGAGGTTQAGTSGSAQTAGIGGSLYGGDGGTGHTTSNDPGAPGNAYGGGGAGGTRNGAGGNGSQGYVVLDYEVFGGPKPFNVNTDATASSSEVDLTIVQQIDLGTNATATVESTEVLVSNFIDFETTTNASVDSDEASIINGTYFRPTTNAAIDSSEATVLADNVFYSNEPATVESTEADIKLDHAFYPNANATVETTEAFIVNEINFNVTRNATCSTEIVSIYNFVNIFPSPLDTEVESSETFITTIKLFTFNAAPETTASDALPGSAVKFLYGRWSPGAISNASTLHLYNIGEVPFFLTAEAETDASTVLPRSNMAFWASANSKVEGTEAFLSNENAYKPTTHTSVESTDPLLERDLYKALTVDASIDTSAAVLDHYDDLSFSAVAETNAPTLQLTGWQDVTLTADAETAANTADLVNTLHFTSTSIAIATSSSSTDVGYHFVFEFASEPSCDTSFPNLHIYGSPTSNIVARVDLSKPVLRQVRKSTLSFKRYTKVYMKQQNNVWELPILSDFNFSQGTILKEVTQNQLGHSTKNINRAREVYTDGVEPATWSFKTYMRPFVSTPGKNEWEANNPYHHAVEEALWANFIQDNKRDPVTRRWKGQFVESEGGIVYQPSSDANSLKMDFRFSNTITLGSFDLYFALAGCEASANDPTTYKITSCVINEAKISFDVEGIATIEWSGFGKLLVEPTASELLDLQSDENITWFTEGIDDISNLIPNSITHMHCIAHDKNQFPGQTPEGELVYNPTTELYEGSGDYLLPLTAGSLIFSNNISHVQRNNMNFVDRSEYLMGTRTIGGDFVTYLSSSRGSSRDLFEQLLESPSEQNLFLLVFVVGSEAEGSHKVTFKFPKAILSIPKHSINDVIEVDTKFAALPSRYDAADEATITYYGAT